MRGKTAGFRPLSAPFGDVIPDFDGFLKKVRNFSRLTFLPGTTFQIFSEAQIEAQIRPSFFWRLRRWPIFNKISQKMTKFEDFRDRMDFFNS